MRSRIFKNNSNANLFNCEQKKLTSGLCAADIAVVLRNISKAFEKPKIANSEVSEALNKLSRLLMKYKDRPINDVLNNLDVVPPRKRGRKRVKLENVINPEEAKSFTLEYIINLLENGNLSKSNLVNIGIGRFGMSRADLMKTKRERVVETLFTAIANIKTIDIIGNAASNR